MSKFVPKPGTFTLFDNRQSKTSDRAPDFKGDLAWLDGTILELAIWVPSDSNGNRYSGTIKRKDGVPQQHQQAPPPPATEPTDDCPF